MIRTAVGKTPQAVAVIIDSQSNESRRDSRPRKPRLRRGEEINGRKRHLVVDTRGLPLLVMVTPADLTDRDAAKEVLFA
jgi:hypothetical protein